jgi:large subunit ribosomal protein L4
MSAEETESKKKAEDVTPEEAAPEKTPARRTRRSSTRLRGEVQEGGLLPAAKAADRPTARAKAPAEPDDAERSGADKEVAKPAVRGKRAAEADEKPAARAAAKPKAREKPADPLQVPLYRSSGKSGGDIKLPATIFGIEPHAAVMHQALVRQLANGRQGTASTKTRGNVRGGGAKPYRQKGTGRARHGSDREPSMVGGGTVFGPHPRSYAQRMPRRMRRLALRSALSVKAREGKVSVLESFDFEEPKTSQMIDLLHDIGVDDTALLVLPAPNLMVARSAGNIPWAKVIIAHNLNLYDILGHDRLVVTRDALELIEETFAAVRVAGSAS